MSRTLHHWIRIKRRRKSARRRYRAILSYIAGQVVERYGEVPKDLEERCWLLLYLSDFNCYRLLGHPLLPGCHWRAGLERPELYVD